MAVTNYNVNNRAQWKIAPITNLTIKYTDGTDDFVYSFSNLKKGSSYSFEEIREPNDEGGFIVVAYQINIDIIPVELVQNYYDKFLFHSRTLKIDTIGVTFGKASAEKAWVYTASNFVATSPTILNHSIEKINVSNNDDLLETGIKVKILASVDLITDTNLIFADLN